MVSPGMVCYAEKQVKPFWSSSLGQMVQFDTIIFCRTFKNYFGQFVWIEKKKKKSHYNSRVSLHEAPTKKEKGLALILLEHHIKLYLSLISFQESQCIVIGCLREFQEG